MKYTRHFKRTFATLASEYIPTPHQIWNLFPRKILKALPEAVTIVPVGQRDGIEKDPSFIPNETKAQIIYENFLGHVGGPIEATAFVKTVPQFDQAEELITRLSKVIDSRMLSALVFNLAGMKRGRDVGVTHFNTVISPSETFCQKNMNASVAKSLERVHVMIQEGAKIERLYLSCVFHDDDGIVPEDKALENLESANALLKQAAQQPSFVISISNGKLNPGQLRSFVTRAEKELGIPASRFALHPHRPASNIKQPHAYILTLPNEQVSIGKHAFLTPTDWMVLDALLSGITTIDAANLGLGGCPYIKDAGGNASVEDLVYFLESLSVKTGVRLHHVIDASTLLNTTLKPQIDAPIARNLQNLSPEGRVAFLSRSAQAWENLQDKTQARYHY